MKNQNLHTYLLGFFSILAIVALALTFTGLEQNKACSKEGIDPIEKASLPNHSAQPAIPHTPLADKGTHCLTNMTLRADDILIEESNDSQITISPVVTGKKGSSQYRSVKHINANVSLNMALETYSIRKLEGQGKNGLPVTGFEFTVETFLGSIEHHPRLGNVVDSTEPTTSQSAPAKTISRWNLIERWRNYRKGV